VFSLEVFYFLSPGGNIMSYLNSVTLIGNLGKNPEVLKETDNGKFVRLQLATTKKYLNAEKKEVEDTQWHTVYLSNGVGKFAATYLHKGDKVLIVGELRNNKWEDEKGVTHYSTSVFGRECKSLSPKSKSKAETEAAVEDASTVSADY
jgi:single-strand DNA-binding protein